MFAVAMRYVNDTFIAEDIIQESFIKAFQKIDDFIIENSFGGWLKRIVINNALDWLKQKKLNQEEFSDAHLNIEDYPDFDWQVESEASVKVICEIIEKLPDKIKVVLKLYLLEGYDHDEISSILNITNVESRTILHRGKQKLVAQLKELRLCMN